MVNAADLKTVNDTNKICKYADDTYLIIPASSEHTRSHELSNTEAWAQRNNLNINRSKCHEMVCYNSRKRIEITPPPETHGITRVNSMNILGVLLTEQLSFSDHVTNKINSCAQSMYALKILRHKGMKRDILHNIFKAVILSRLTYGSPTWSGFLTTNDSKRIETFLERCIKFVFYADKHTTFAGLCDTIDNRLFLSILNNNNHLLHHFLPPASAALESYDLRPRKHNRELPKTTSNLGRRNFITRILLADAY